MLGVNSLYRLFCFFKLIPMVGKGLISLATHVVQESLSQLYYYRDIYFQFLTTAWSNTIQSHMHLSHSWATILYNTLMLLIAKATAFPAAPPPWGMGTLWRRRLSFCRTSSCGTIGSNYVIHLLNIWRYTVTTGYRYTVALVYPSKSIQQPALYLLSITVIPTELNTWSLWMPTFFSWMTSSFSRRVLSFSNTSKYAGTHKHSWLHILLYLNKRPLCFVAPQPPSWHNITRSQASASGTGLGTHHIHTCSCWISVSFPSLASSVSWTANSLSALVSVTSICTCGTKPMLPTLSATYYNQQLKLWVVNRQGINYLQTKGWSPKLGGGVKITLYLSCGWWDSVCGCECRSTPGWPFLWFVCGTNQYCSHNDLDQWTPLLPMWALF